MMCTWMIELDRLGWMPDKYDHSTVRWWPPIFYPLPSKMVLLLLPFRLPPPPHPPAWSPPAPPRPDPGRCTMGSCHRCCVFTTKKSSQERYRRWEGEWVFIGMEPTTNQIRAEILQERFSGMALSRERGVKQEEVCLDKQEYCAVRGPCGVPTGCVVEIDIECTFRGGIRERKWHFEDTNEVPLRVVYSGSLGDVLNCG